MEQSKGLIPQPPAAPVILARPSLCQLHCELKVLTAQCWAESCEQGASCGCSGPLSRGDGGADRAVGGLGWQAGEAFSVGRILFFSCLIYRPWGQIQQ